MSTRTIKIGDKYQDRYGVVKVIGFVENYVAARRPNCAPFLVHNNEFGKKFTRVQAAANQISEAVSGK